MFICANNLMVKINNRSFLFYIFLNLFKKIYIWSFSHLFLVFLFKYILWVCQEISYRKKYLNSTQIIVQNLIQILNIIFFAYLMKFYIFGFFNQSLKANPLYIVRRWHKWSGNKTINRVSVTEVIRMLEKLSLFKELDLTSLFIFLLE